MLMLAFNHNTVSPIQPPIIQRNHENRKSRMKRYKNKMRALKINKYFLIMQLPTKL